MAISSGRVAPVLAFAAGLAMVGAAHAETQALIGPKKPPADQAAIIQRAFGARYGSLLPYNSGRADLNGDGKPDLIIWPQNATYCGVKGCMMFVVPTTTRGYGAPHEMIVSQDATVTVLNSAHGGMRDISFSGRLAGSRITYRWDGQKYVDAGPPDDGSLAFACQGPLAAKGRKIVADDELPVGGRPGACFATAPIYNLGAGEIIAIEPSLRCPGTKAIDAHTRAIAGSYYAIFNAPVCGSSVRLGPPLDMRRIATIVIDGRRYAGDAGGNFKPLR
jgi:hypothetical protein